MFSEMPRRRCVFRFPERACAAQGTGSRGQGGANLAPLFLTGLHSFSLQMKIRNKSAHLIDSFYPALHNLWGCSFSGAARACRIIFTPGSRQLSPNFCPCVSGLVWGGQVHTFCAAATPEKAINELT